MIRRFFLCHGPEFAQGLSRLCGAPATQRLASRVGQLEIARRIDHHIRRELTAIHRLMSLQNVGHPDNIETALFLGLHRGSSEVLAICRLTDMPDDLLRELDAAADRRSGSPQTCASHKAWHFVRQPMPGGLAVTSGHSGCADEEVLMNTRQQALKGLDDLATTAVQLGRELCRSDPRSA